MEHAQGNMDIKFTDSFPSLGDIEPHGQSASWSKSSPQEDLLGSLQAEKSPTQVPYPQDQSNQTASPLGQSSQTASPYGQSNQTASPYGHSNQPVYLHGQSVPSPNLHNQSNTSYPPGQFNQTSYPQSWSSQTPIWQDQSSMTIFSQGQPSVPTHPHEKPIEVTSLLDLSIPSSYQYHQTLNSWDTGHKGKQLQPQPIAPSSQFPNPYHSNVGARGPPAVNAYSKAMSGRHPLGDSLQKWHMQSPYNLYPVIPKVPDFSPNVPVKNLSLALAQEAKLEQGFSDLSMGEYPPSEFSANEKLISFDDSFFSDISESDYTTDYPVSEYSIRSRDSDIFSLDSRLHGQGSKRQYYLKLSELPSPLLEEELRAYFEDRRQSGGGPIKCMTFNPEAHTADIYFTDSDVIQQVMKRIPLLLKGKKISVDMASENLAPEPRKLAESPEISCTLEVRGVKEADVEMLLLYFENPNKGGGDIKDHKLDTEKNAFYITFTDPEVPKSLLKTTHTVANKVLDLALYEHHLKDEIAETCTIEVHGFDPSMEEIYRLYFESPKKGGGEIVDFRTTEDKKVLYVTFNKPEVAKQMASKPKHKVGGHEILVCLSTKQASTIMVKGCDLAKEEVYRMYFESPKYGGGDIKDMRVDKKQQIIYITFEDAKVAEAVCSKSHTIVGRAVEVSLCKSNSSVLHQKSNQKMQEDRDTPLCTVQVKVGKHIESQDVYLYHFENKRNHGGEVEKVEIVKDRGIVLVTFTDPKVAARVAEKSHTIQGQNVEVKLYTPPKPRPTYPNKLLLQNVKENTTKDCLTMFLENIAGLEPKEILFGDEPGIVLITFEEEPDFKKVQDACLKKTLEGNSLTVSKVPISNCILVENLNPLTTNETIQLYFENKRSLGGEVEQVKRLTGENKCLVYFEDYQVIDRVLTKTHTIDGKELTLKCYMECLGPSGGNLDENIFSLPKPLVLKDVDPQKLAFIKQSLTAQDGFRHQLSPLHAVPKIVDNTLTVECILTSSVPKARLLAKTWAGDVHHSVCKYLDLLEVHKLEIMQEIWPEAVRAINEISLAKQDSAIFFLQPQENVVIIAGIRSMASDLFKKITITVRNIEKDVEQKKKEIKETNRNLKPFQLRLLSAVSFQREMVKQQAGLSMEIRLESGEVHFQGLLADVKGAQVEMLTRLNSVKSEKIVDMSNLQKLILDNKEVRDFILRKFRAEKIIAEWEQNQEAVIVHAFSDPEVVKGVHIMRKSIIQHTYPLSPASTQLLQSQDWQKLVRSLLSANPSKLKIDSSQDHQSVLIAGTDDIMHGAVEEVQRFMQENTIYSEVYSFSPSRQKLIASYCIEELMSIASRLQAYKIHLSIDNGGKDICVKGTEKGLEVIQSELRKLGEKIVCHVQTITDEAKVKFLTSERSRKDLDLLGASSQCVLALTEEPSGLQVLKSSRISGMSGMSADIMKTLSSVQLPCGATVSAVQGDLTQMSVDVIVNAANSRMDHMGGLARHIVEKGGKVIQEESYRMLKSRNSPMSEGDIIMTGPGILPCKSIIHAVGPMYRGGRSGEENCLFDTVMKCLDAANSSGCTSIAIPAISSGIFNYPVDESTKVVVEAVKTYTESHRRNGISKIYLCDITPGTVQHFCNALRKTFPLQLTTASNHKPPSRHASSYASCAMGDKSQVQIPSHQRQIRVSIIDGEIAKQNTDIIVNSTSTSLDLKNGAVSASILAGAGSNLLMECKTRYPSGIRMNEIARTSGHGLDCKEVFHIALCNYTNQNSQKILECLMTKCLTEASNSNHTSIAFPALGTGNLGFPHQVVASTMLGAIDSFQQATPFTTLRDVRIVIYKDMQAIQEFQQTYSQSQKQLEAVNQSSNRTMGSRKSRSFPSANDYPCIVNQSSNRTMGSRKSRSFPSANDYPYNANFPVDMEVDTYALEQVQLYIYGVDQSAISTVLRAFDDLMSDKFMRKEFNDQELVQLEQNQWQRIHDIERRYSLKLDTYPLLGRIVLNGLSKDVLDAWQDIYDILREADHRQHEEKAAGYLADMVQWCYLEVGNELKEFEPRVNQTIEMAFQGKKQSVEIRVSNGNTCSYIIEFEAMTGYNKFYPSDKVRVLRKDKIKDSDASALPFTWTQTGQDTLVSLIHLQPTDFEYQQVEQNFRTTLGNTAATIMSIERIQNCTLYRQYQAKKLHMERQNVGIQNEMTLWHGTSVDTTENINHYGFNRSYCSTYEDVGPLQVVFSFDTTGSMAAALTEVRTRISEMLKRLQDDIPGVTNSVVAHGDYCDIATYITKHVDFTNNLASLVNFVNTVSATNGGDTPEAYEVMLRLVRRDLTWTPGSQRVLVVIGDAYPHPATDPQNQERIDWMAEAKLLADMGVRIYGVQVNTDPNSTQFFQTLVNMTGGQHLKMSQFSTLCDVIMAICFREKGAQFLQNYEMEVRAREGHRPLHHDLEGVFGTLRQAADVRPKASTSNATAYGEGVYFSVKSEYFANPKNNPPCKTTGNQYIYQCKVLVGYPVKSDPNMRFLPFRAGGIAYDSAADDPNNPGIYVIFSDTQAYPEYIITFR